MHQLDLRDRLDRALEGLEIEAALGGQAHAEKHHDAEAELLAVEHDAAAADHAAFLQPPDPAPGGGLAEADARAHLLGAEPAIGDQGAQDRPVGVVKVDHNGSRSEFLSSETSISASSSAICGRARMRSR